MIPKQQLKKLLKELLLEEETVKEPKYPIHRHAVLPWQKTMETGTLIGKPFSPHTIQRYLRYVRLFFTRYDTISFSALKDLLEETSVEQFAKRNDIYQAIVCFGKFLVREDSLDEGFLEDVARIKPKPHKAPKRTSLNAIQLQALKDACQTHFEQLIITMLSSTGLRASEFCNLKVKDINLDEGYLVVERGKGGKRRRVGLTSELIALLKVHFARLQDFQPDAPAFLNALGEQIDRYGLLTRVYTISERAGVQASPHALRRTFVTINANKGRSLVMLQMACGHSDIKTTRSYCQTSEDEVIQAMKDWG